MSNEAIRPLRDEEAAASAVVHALAIENERLERSLEAAAEEVRRLTAEIERIEADDAREKQLGEDAATAIAKLEGEQAALQARVEALPAQLPEREAALALREAERYVAEEAFESLAAQIAAARARAETLESRRDEAARRLSRTVRALAPVLLRRRRGRSLAAEAPSRSVSDARKRNWRISCGALKPSGRRRFTPRPNAPRRSRSSRRPGRRFARARTNWVNSSPKRVAWPS